MNHPLIIEALIREGRAVPVVRAVAGSRDSRRDPRRDRRAQVLPAVRVTTALTSS